MATFVQNGDKVRFTEGSSVHDYNINDVEYDHNGSTLVVLVNGYAKHSVKYSDITSPSSTSLEDLVDQLNDFKVSIDVNLDTSGLATEPKQDDIITELQGIGSKVTSTDSVFITDDYLSTLANGAEIDSGWIDMSKVDKYQFIGKASVAGMTLVIESSNVSGGGEADTITTTLIDDSPFHLFSVPARDKWMRFRWQNNTGAGVTDAYLGIKQTFGSSDKASIFPTYTTPSIFSQAELVQAILRGKDINDVFREVKVNPNGEIQTARYVIDAARGEILGISKYSLRGNNPDVDTGSAPEDVWEAGGDYTGFNATTGQAIEVSSSSGQDSGDLVSSGVSTGGSSTTLEDTGATFISDGVAVGDVIINDTDRFHGIVSEVTSETVLTVYRFKNGIEDDAVFSLSSGKNYRVATTDGNGAAVIKLRKLVESDYSGYLTEYVIMNGGAGVNTVGTDYIRGSEAIVIIAGSNGAAQGTIEAHQATSTSNVFWELESDENKTQTCADTIPKGYTAFVWVSAQMSRVNGSPGSATVQFLSRPVGEVFEDEVFTEISNSSNYTSLPEEVHVIPEETDIKWRVKDVSDNNTRVTAKAIGYIIQNG